MKNKNQGFLEKLQVRQ